MKKIGSSKKWIRDIPTIKENIFVKRRYNNEDLEKYLNKHLLDANTSSIIAITGPIGSGKSMVAYAYANSYAESYKNSCCVDLREVSLSVPHELKNQLELWYKENLKHDSLIILDNVSDDRIISQLLPDISSIGKIHIIITTLNISKEQAEANDGWIEEICIPMFDEEEVVVLLHQHGIKQIGRMDALKSVRYNPLFVRQYAMQVKNQVEGRKYDLEMKFLLEKKLTAKGEFCSLSFYQRLQMQLELFQTYKPELFNALLSLQFYPPENINIKIFPEDVQRSLIDYGIAYQESAENYSINLIYLFSIKFIAPSYEKLALQVYIKTLNYLYDATTKLFDNEPFNFHDTYPVDSFCNVEKLLAPFLKDKINLSDKEALGKKAVLFLRIAYLCYRKDKMEEAEQFNDKAIKLSQLLYIKDRKAEIGYFELLRAMILYEQGKVSQAETLLKAIDTPKPSSYLLASLRDKSPHSDAILAIARSCLGRIYLRQNRLELAGQTLALALDAKEKVKDNIELAITQFNYANYWYSIGNYQKAYEYYKTAHENLTAGHAEKYKEAEQINTFDPLFECYLGNCLRVMGNNKEAEKHINSARERLKKVFKNEENHPYIAIADIALAKLLFSQYKLADAEEILENAKKFVKLSKEFRVEVFHYLGKIYIEQAHFEKARTNLVSALEIWQEISKTHDPGTVEEVDEKLAATIAGYVGVKSYKRVNHADYAKVLHYLALNFYKYGRYEIAELLYQEKLLINAKELKLDLVAIKPENYKELLAAFKAHKRIKFATTFVKLANIRYRCHHYNEAIELLKEVLSLQQEVFQNFGTEELTKDIKKTKHSLARVYMACLDYNAVDALLPKNGLDENQVDVVDICFLYLKAYLFYQQGKFRQAKKDLKRAFQFYEKLVENAKIKDGTPAKVPLLLLDAQINLEFGNRNRALRAALDAESIHSRFLLAQHPDCIAIYRTLADIHLVDFKFLEAKEYYFMAERLLGKLNNIDPNNPEQYCLQFHLCWLHYQLGERALYEDHLLTAHKYYTEALDTIVPYMERTTMQVVEQTSLPNILAREVDIISLHLILMRIEARLSQLEKKEDRKAINHFIIVKNLIKERVSALPISWLYAIDDLLPYEASFSQKLQQEFLIFLEEKIAYYKKELIKPREKLLLARLCTKYGFILKKYKSKRKEAILALRGAATIFSELGEEQRKANSVLIGHIQMVIAHLEHLSQNYPHINQGTLLDAYKKTAEAAKKNIFYRQLFREAEQILKELKIKQPTVGNRNRQNSNTDVLYQRKPIILSTNKNFHGRKKELDQLRNFLSNDKQICHILGESGIGKTYLVSHLFNDFSKHRKILWMNAENQNAFYSALRYWGRELDLEIEYSSDDELLDKLRAKIFEFTPEKVLFVFDSVNNLKDISIYMHELFGKSENYKMLIIQEDFEQPTSSNDYKFQILNDNNQQESIKLTRTDSNWQQEISMEVEKLEPKQFSHEMAKLLQWVEYHPVAINLVLGNFKSFDKLCAFSEFVGTDENLQQYSGKSLELLLLFMFSKVLAERETIFIQTLAYLRGGELPQVLFEDIFPNICTPVLSSQQELKGVLDKFVQLGLLQVIEKDKCYVMHRLLQKLIQSSTEQDSSRMHVAYECAVKAVSKHLKFDRRNPLTFSEMNEYWLHGIELLKFSKRANSSLASLLSKMRISIGEYYLYYLHDASGALSFFHDTQSETAHADTVKLTNLVAYAHYARGEYKEAETELKKVMQLLSMLQKEKEMNEQNKLFLTEQEGMVSFTSAKIFHAASRKYQEALDGFKDILTKINSFSENVSHYYSDKGLIFHEIGKAYLALARIKKSENELEEAEFLFQSSITAYNDALKLFDSRPDKFYPLNVRTLLAKAFALVCKDDVSGAEAVLASKDLFLKNIQQSDSVFGINGAQLCLIEAMIAHEKEQYEVAEQKIKKAIELKEASKEGEYDKDGLIESYFLQGKIYLIIGFYKQASTAFKNAKEIVAERFHRFDGEDDRRLLLELYRRTILGMLLSKEINTEAENNISFELFHYSIEAKGNLRHEAYVKFYSYNLAILQKSINVSNVLAEMETLQSNMKSSHKDEVLEMLYHQTMGHIYYYQNNYPQSIEEYRKANKVIENASIHIKVYKALHYRMIGTCYYELSQFVDAFEAYQNALVVQKEAYINNRIFRQPKLAETFVLMARALLHCASKSAANLALEMLYCANVIITNHGDLGSCEQYFRGILDFNGILKMANQLYKYFSNTDYVQRNSSKLPIALTSIYTQLKQNEKQFKAELKAPQKNLMTLTQDIEGEQKIVTTQSYTAINNLLTAKENDVASNNMNVSTPTIPNQVANQTMTSGPTLVMQNQATVSMELTDTTLKLTGTEGAVSNLLSKPVHQTWHPVLQPSNQNFLGKKTAELKAHISGNSKYVKKEQHIGAQIDLIDQQEGKKVAQEDKTISNPKPP